MISVIIPAFNEEKVLPETLRALLAQPGEYEVIAVDGGSMDRTLAVLADFERVKRHDVRVLELTEHLHLFDEARPGYLAFAPAQFQRDEPFPPSAALHLFPAQTGSVTSQRPLQTRR